MRFRTVVAIASTLAVSVSIAGAAWAECTRLSFSVNDYGKEGPTKDAKNLLDKYIAKWAAEHGIKKYSAGTKEVSCDLFLNFIVFDEHTCTATSNVCWEGGMPGPLKDAKTTTPLLNKAAAKAPPASQPVTTTGSVKPAPAVKAPAPSVTPVPAKASAVVAPASTVVAAPAPATPVQTAPSAPPAASPEPVAATASAASGN